MNRPLQGDAPLAVPHAEVSQAREQLAASLGALEARLHELRDWRVWVQRHPLPFLAGAFAAGVLLGLRRR